jgi:precorrin-6A synthase
VTRTLLLVGIGAGDPDQITVEAITALNRADVAFLVEKGTDADELVDARRTLCEKHVKAPGLRFVVVPDAARDRSAGNYTGAVDDWRRRRAANLASALRSELPEEGCGALLIWGDPSLYDSMIAVVDEIRASESLDLAVEVIPGISSVQVLAARHGITLNRIGRPVMITTGRLLAQGLPDNCDDVIVMLDAHCSYKDLPAEVRSQLDIYWGAYLGTADEILVAGALDEVGEEIIARRKDARERKGWVMDTYLLRRR